MGISSPIKCRVTGGGVSGIVASITLLRGWNVERRLAGYPGKDSGMAGRTISRGDRERRSNRNQAGGSGAGVVVVTSSKE